jgi:hypothetical protein
MSKKTYPMIERQGAAVVVTAHSTVQAQQAAADALGSDCTITHVERVQEGGLGGFFATELVRVTAQPVAAPAAQRAEHEEMDAVLASADDLVSSLRARVPHFADRLLAEWSQEPVEPLVARGAPRAVAEPLVSESLAALVTPVSTPVTHYEPHALHLPGHQSSYTAGRQVPSYIPTSMHTPVHHSHLQQDVLAPVPPAPVHTPAAPVTAVHQTGAAGGWSAEALRSLGLPDRIVDAALAMNPTTEGQWIVALMSILRDYCGKQSVISTVMVGPTSADLARQLKLVTVVPEELSESVSSVALMDASASVLGAGLNGRQVHLVVGGEWQHLVSVPVHIVSASSAGDLMVAVRVAAAWNATLGWHRVGGRYERIDEFCVIEMLRTVLRDGERAGAR